jgi:hypothetical protein
MNLYLLDKNNEPVPIEDMITWVTGYSRMDRVVGRDQIDRITISTVFLGLDHNYSGVGGPVLWETMVFGGCMNGDMHRYRSHADAVSGHREVLSMVLDRFYSDKKLTDQGK